MTPEGCAPFLVEGVKLSIATAQPGLEGLSADRTIATVAKLVVNLPADDRRVLRIVFGHLCHNAAGMVVIDRVVRTVCAAIAERQTLTVFAYAKDVGMLGHQPRGR